jgi:hypothetical protein
MTVGTGAPRWRSWPVLARSAADALLAAIRGLPLEQARLAARTTHPATSISPLHPAATDADVARLQARLREAVDDAGWPEPPSGGAADLVDRRIGAVLVEEMELTPVAARDPMLWAFLALVALPDVALWRWRDAPVDRFLALEHHVFGRLWWRETVLGEALHAIGDGSALSDADLTAIFRRRELVANHEVARAIVRVAATSGPTGDGRSARLQAGLRDLMHLTPLVDLDALHTDDLESVIRLCLQGSRLG